MTARRGATGPTAVAFVILLAAARAAAAAPEVTNPSPPEPAPADAPASPAPADEPVTMPPVSDSPAAVPSPTIPAQGAPSEPPPVTLPFVAPPAGTAGPDAVVRESEAGRGATPNMVPSRPRFDVSVRMGPSFEAGTAVPAFAVGAGVGGGPLGFVAEICSTQASGRFHGASASRAIDRLALDALLAVRVLAIAEGDGIAGGSRARPETWPLRMARSVALQAGVGMESDSVSQQSIKRIGLVFGAQVDLPLTPTSMTSEVRLRFGVRRLFSGTRRSGTASASDSAAQVLGGLAVVF